MKVNGMRVMTLGLGFVRSEAERVGLIVVGWGWRRGLKLNIILLHIIWWAGTCTYLLRVRVLCIWRKEGPGPWLDDLVLMNFISIRVKYLRVWVCTIYLYFEKLRNLFYVWPFLSSLSFSYCYPCPFLSLAWKGRDFSFHFTFHHSSAKSQCQCQCHISQSQSSE
jgi:hypothetical protein